MSELLVNMPGIIEATLVQDETDDLARSHAVAYVKVDEKLVDLLAVKALLHQQT